MPPTGFKFESERLFYFLILSDAKWLFSASHINTKLNQFVYCIAKEISDNNSVQNINNEGELLIVKRKMMRLKLTRIQKEQYGKESMAKSEYHGETGISW